VAQQIAELSERTSELELALGTNRAILEAALDAVVTMDLQGDIIGWNAQAEQLFSIRPKRPSAGRWPRW
jgi:PAS domain-containing protein